VKGRRRTFRKVEPEVEADMETLREVAFGAVEDSLL
jgi:hypothetical protein